MPRGVQKGYERIRGLSIKIKNKFGNRLKTMEGCLDAMEYLYLNRKSNMAFLRNSDFNALDGGYCFLRAEVNGDVDCRECDERYEGLVKKLDKITESVRLGAERHRLRRLKKERNRRGEKSVEVFHLPENYRGELNCYGTWPLVPARLNENT